MLVTTVHRMIQSGTHQPSVLTVRTTNPIFKLMRAGLLCL